MRPPSFSSLSRKILFFLGFFWVVNRPGHNHLGFLPPDPYTFWSMLLFPFSFGGDFPLRDGEGTKRG